MRTLIKRRLVIGHLFAAAGAGLMAASIASSGYGLILGGLSLLGVGMGFIMPAMTAGVLMSSPTETSGLASGILNSARQVGGTLGVALMGTLLQLHHEHGMLWSYGLNVACYLAMAALSISALREQE
jgi:DHA2 family methylenomycin A resistance protein-like MFS transporter